MAIPPLSRRDAGRYIIDRRAGKQYRFYWNGIMIRYSTVAFTLMVLFPLYGRSEDSPRQRTFKFQHLTPTTKKTDIDSGMITTSDSARFESPPARKVLGGLPAEVRVVPRCEVDSVTIFVNHSSGRTDTLARLSNPPYAARWDYSRLQDQDQMHLQFGYLLHRSRGRTIISRPLPHRWAIDRSARRSRKVYRCRQVTSPDSVTIDGNLGEWKNVRRGRIDGGSVFALRWTSAILYFAAEVGSREISPSHCVELHLDPYRAAGTFASENHRSIRFSPLTRSYCIASCEKGDGYGQCDSIASLLSEGMTWSVSVSETGYTIEAALPFYALSDLEFPKLRLGCDVTTCSDEPDARFSSWAGSGPYTRYNPSEWGTVVLQQAMLPVRIAFLSSILVAAVIMGFILYHLARNYLDTERLENVESRGGSDLFQRIRDAVENSLDDNGLTVTVLASITGLKETTIEKALRDELDCTFERFLRFTRVNMAKKKLWSVDLPLEEIARSCGFSSVDALNDSFREFLRTDPVSFRTNIKEIIEEDQPSQSNTV